MTIVLVGSLAIDRIMDFPGLFVDHLLPEKIHQLNVSFTIERLEERYGGTAGNIAYNLSLLGERPVIVSALGNDGQEYLQRLMDRGFPTETVEVQQNLPTASAYIMTDQGDNQITAFCLGAMQRETHFAISQCDSKDTLVIISASNINDMRHYIAACQERGMRYVFDPGQMIPSLLDDDLRIGIEHAALLVVSDYEFQMMMNRTKLSEERIRSMVPLVVVTAGARGSTIFTSDDTVSIPACEAQRVEDPTGAGDAYRAGLIKGFVLGLPIEQMGRVAATSAVYAVEHYGTQEHHYTLAEFASRYKENFNEPSPLH